MKKFYYLVAGVLSMGMLAACSNEDDIATGNQDGDKTGAYLTLTLVGVDNGASRTQVPSSPGSDGENQIKSAKVVLCNETGTISQVVTASNLTATDAGVQTNPIEVAEGDYYVYVIANAPATYSPTGTIADAKIEAITEEKMTEPDGFAHDGSFIMFSACNGNAATDTQGAKITVTEANDYDNPATTAKPIELDRLAAKITYAEVETIDISAAQAQLDDLTAITFQGFKLLNAIAVTNLQQHWNAAAPTNPTVGTEIENLLVTPASPTFYHEWGDYNVITNPTGEYTEVTDKMATTNFTKDALFCMENNTGAGVEANYLQGNTTGVLYKAFATVATSDGNAGTNCFYGFNGQYFATLAALQEEYPSVFDKATGSTPEEKLNAATEELKACVAGTGGASVSDFRVKYLVRVYQNGAMYYTHYITDQNYTHNGENYHAVMRNTIYGLTIQSVKNIGDDVPGGWNPDVDPEEPIDVPNYLTVQCKVNPWVLSNYNVDLQ